MLISSDCSLGWDGVFSPVFIFLNKDLTTAGCRLFYFTKHYG